MKHPKYWQCALLLLAAVLTLASCETLAGAATQVLDAPAIAEIVTGVLEPRLAAMEADFVARLTPAIASIPGITPEQITGLTGSFTDALSGLKGSLTGAIKESIVSAIPEPPEGSEIGLLGQLLMTAIGMAGAYYGVNLRRDGRRRVRGEPVRGPAPQLQPPAAG